MCSACKRIKPLADFKRKLSRAQSQARGYAGNVPLEIESSMCSECQPRTRGVHELTPKELRNKVASGDMNRAKAEQIVAARQRKANISRKLKASAQWMAAKTVPWGEIMGSLREELASIQQKEKHAKNRYPDLDLTFFLEYKLLLAQMRERIKFECDAKGIPPKYLDWELFVHYEERLRIKRLWEAMPFEYRKGVTRLPAMVTYIPKEDREAKPIKSLRNGPPAWARLEQAKREAKPVDEKDIPSWAKITRPEEPEPTPPPVDETAWWEDM